MKNGNKIYKEFRKDGFPLCPRCGEDELYSVLMLNWNGEGEPPTLEACINSEMRCYYCNFVSPRLGENL